MEDTSIAFENDGYEILIDVNNPRLKGEHITHMTYMLVGQDKLGPIKVQRRFSDFVKTRAVLIIRWPGCYIPPVPSKKIVGNYEAEFVEERMRGFRFFLNSLKRISYLWYSQETQLLLKQTIIQDIEKPLSALSSISTQELLQRYQKTFHELKQKSPSPDDQNKITLFAIYLKKALGILRDLMDVSKSHQKNTQDYRQNAVTLLTYFLPQYQKNCIKQYVPVTQNNKQEDIFIFYGNKDQILHQQINHYKTTTEKINPTLAYQQLRLEKRQIKTFTQTIDILNNYKSQHVKAQQKVKLLEADKLKLYAGKQTVAKVIKAKSKQQAIKQIQYSIIIAQKQRSNFNEIVELATVLLSHIQIDKFKKRRQQSYYANVKAIGQQQLSIAKAQNELWKSILKSEALSAIDPF